MKTLLVLLVFLFVSIVAAFAQHAPIVHTAQGKLRGKIVKSWTGKPILSFIGVRFAEPPTGSNRLKDPVPVRPWPQIKDAMEDGPLCLQPGLPAELPSSEDCLFLNVHTKTLRGKQPVMIYFHPGGFVGGTGNNNYTGPQYLLDKDIVLVSSNYRLGPLGFYSTGDEVIPGNFGLKDQLLVMKWVKENIKHFGGDPDSVTLFGYSAGAGSVQLHMLSPLSRGLFHRAISSSCSATTPAVLNRYPIPLSRRFAKLLNCPIGNSQQIQECIQRLPANDIIAATSKIWDTLQPPFSLFAPVVEKHKGNNSFLTEDPIELIRTKQFTQVPLITGFTRDEFNWRAQYLLTNETYVHRINTEFDDIAPWEFHYPRQPRIVSKHISDAFKDFYFHNQPIGNHSEKELGELYADSLIIFSVYQAGKLIAEKSSAPVYFYLFDFDGRYSYRYKLGTNIPYGVGHHDDLLYLFFSANRSPLFNQTDPEAYMVRTLTSIYTDFAKTGTPSLSETSDTWQPMAQGHLQFLRLKNPPKMEEGLPYPQRMHVWESELPLNGPHRQLLY
ncbi:juvenile hormone esterase-like isoform X1 [Macrosteles quadrilineatus]|uniref:juvenile hormone esterase-like isoform X1 n=1 Tax=Macrosteles quadrilineatus TaxID=74068 RepID=UPI0023E25161|nr:juvenile hormone esterase-like isoform X1 [Macrosteles quadrilineatus]